MTREQRVQFVESFAARAAEMVAQAIANFAEALDEGRGDVATASQLRLVEPPPAPAPEPVATTTKATRVCGKMAAGARMILDGRTDAEITARLGVNPRTVYNWRWKMKREFAA